MSTSKAVSIISLLRICDLVLTRLDVLSQASTGCGRVVLFGVGTNLDLGSLASEIGKLFTRHAIFLSEPRYTLERFQASSLFDLEDKRRLVAFWVVNTLEKYEN